MSNDNQSIKSLIGSGQSQGDDDDKSPAARFAKKQKELKEKGIELDVQKLAAKLGFGYINLHGFPITPDALQLISREDSERLRTVCFFYDGSDLRFATTQPPSQEVMDLLDQLREQYFSRGGLYLTSEKSLKYAFDAYDRLPKIRKPAKGVEITEEELNRLRQDITDYKAVNEKINKANASEVVSLVIAAAMETDSSDIHVEAEESGIAVRLRIDGVLHEIARLDNEKWKKIISRLKLLAKVKINITDKPQDGRFTIFLSNDKIDVRCSFLPTSFGESVVMRLLKSSSIGLSFSDLGMRPIQLGMLEKEIRKPNGLILTTGPTGSGKTTTLYAVLNQLNAPETKIITLEDPIEYKLEGINQSQVDPSRDYTFSKGLRSILRQDPDILMVGEMRDFETAEIAIQASLTGHLVLSTLHTNDAAGVIPRLLDMGIKPFFLSPAVNCIIGQRLVRKVCPHCRVEHVLNPEEETSIKKILAVISPKSGIDVPSELPVLYKAGPGCERCKGVGYKGRIGIYEIFTMNNEIKQLTADNAPSFRIMEQAIESGMVTMLQDGVLKCLEGVTDFTEVARVIGKFDYIDALYDVVVAKTIGRGIHISQAEIARAEILAKDVTRIGEAIAGLPTRELLGLAVASALKMEAGDIHIDPAENSVRLRFRIDGVMYDIAELGKEHYIPMLAQIKELAGFALSAKKAVYDGRFAIFPEGAEKMDCRVSIISGGYGETAVIRVLSSQAASLKVEEMGLRPPALDTLNQAISKTRGVVITTGPTGSGKTTTLYALLNKLNKPDIKVITIEDPIEYHLSGIMQTQVDQDQGYTFAAALRSLMRQNPNIIMIGEIRDNETAKVTIDAAQTGHLVLSTVHANSAAGAIARLAGLGIDRQSLAGSLECSIGQRLVRQICPHCKQPDELSPEMLKEVEEILNGVDSSTGIKVPAELKFYKGAGCERCGHLGYKGRIGIYEAITMSPEMQKLVQQPGITDGEIESVAVKNGTLLMLQDGILKALAGETTVEEVFRVAK